MAIGAALAVVDGMDGGAVDVVDLRFLGRALAGFFASRGFEASS